MTWIHGHRLSAAWLLTLCGLLACWPAQAQTDAAPIQAQSAPLTTLAFTWEVQSKDEEIRQFLLKHMELQRYQALSDLDETELNRLLADAKEQAQELLATLGFFNPELSWQYEPSRGPSKLGLISLNVQAGTPAVSYTHLTLPTNREV